MSKIKIQDVSGYEDSVGHELYSMANKLFWLIVILVTLLGALLGALLSNPNDRSAVAIVSGIVSFIFSFNIANHYVIFIEAKAELLLRTALIQENIEYLCRVKASEHQANAPITTDDAPVDHKGSRVRIIE